MTNIIDNTQFELLSTGQAAKILGITPLAASRLVREGRLPATRVGRFYVVSRSVVEELAKTYVAHRGRPRTKRKYTKRSPRWNSQ